MKIIIVGDGKMGFALSQRLSDEGHDIVIIDNNPAVLRLSSNTQDVGCICEPCLHRARRKNQSHRLCS